VIRPPSYHADALFPIVRAGIGAASLLWHRAATGRVDRRRTIPKDKLTAADIEPMTLSPDWCVQPDLFGLP
jgi:hypothetical protein